MRQLIFHMSNVIETSKYWDNESNCAQAVSCGLLDYFNMSEHVGLIHDAMTGFGGGMGERSICGAVTGGLAALGILLKKKGIGTEQRSEIFRKYNQAFINDFNTLDCKEIIADFILPDGSVDRDRPERRILCTKAVNTAAKIVKDIFNEL